MYSIECVRPLVSIQNPYYCDCRWRGCWWRRWRWCRIRGKWVCCLRDRTSKVLNTPSSLDSLGVTMGPGPQSDSCLGRLQISPQNACSSFVFCQARLVPSPITTAGLVLGAWLAPRKHLFSVCMTLLPKVRPSLFHLVWDTFARLIATQWVPFPPIRVVGGPRFS